MEPSPIRVLVVEDNEPWRRLLCSILGNEPEFQVIGEASDGLEAVQKVEALRPDLILLDIGLPTLNGIEAARRIRDVFPMSRILFVSHNQSADIAQEALSTGAGGFLVKSDVAQELLPAVDAILAGKRFVSATLLAQDSGARKNDHGAAITHSHEVAFYADDGCLVDGYARFIEFSLQGGHAVIVVVSESHRASLLAKLEADGVDVPAAIARRRYIPLDADDALSRLTVNDMPDPVRCTKVVGDLIMKAAKGVEGTNSRVAICGETSPTLLSKGNAEGAIKLEHLWDEITRHYGVPTLCGYLSNAFPQHETNPVFQRICAEHSAVHGWEPRRQG